jgi:hypothetical protein
MFSLPLLFVDFVVLSTTRVKVSIILLLFYFTKSSTGNFHPDAEFVASLFEGFVCFHFNFFCCYFRTSIHLGYRVSAYLHFPEPHYLR